MGVGTIVNRTLNNNKKKLKTKLKKNQHMTCDK